MNSSIAGCCIEAEAGNIVEKIPFFQRYAYFIAHFFSSARTIDFGYGDQLLYIHLQQLTTTANLSTLLRPLSAGRIFHPNEV